MDIIFDGVENIYGQPNADFYSLKKAALEKCHQNEDYGFLKMEGIIEQTITQCETLEKKFAHKTQFIQVGIGGSALGPEMLISALKKSKREFTFINNIDPDKLNQQLANLTATDSLFYIVSKSGSTAETMANFSIICQWLKGHGIGSDQLADYFVFATDPVKGDLREMSKQYGVDCLEVPDKIGGRYSVLTSVGLLPAIFGGLDLKALLTGYNEAKATLFNNDKNGLFTACYYLEKAFENKINQTVIMPYSSTLREMSDWFVQLWAESLGKKKNLAGEVVETGLTPIASYGATDQHSQMQLFMEGPRDKMLMIIEIEKFQQDYPLANDFSQGALAKLAPFSLAQLFKAELEGTKAALKESKRPYLLFKMNQVSETELAKMVFMLESLTVLMGDYLGIDPLNQPGVEAGKRYAHNWLQENIDKN